MFVTVSAEAATKTVSSNICVFFPGPNFLKIFQEALFVNRTELFFKEAVTVPRTETIFPGFLGVHRLFVEHVRFFQDALSNNRSNAHYYSRKPYLFIEHMRIFQETLSGLGTHTNFQETLCHRKDIVI